MKKLILILLATAMVLCFAACGATDEGGNDPTAEPGKKVLTLATSADFPPYEYIEGDSFAGIDIEIAQAIAEKIGCELDIQNVEFGSIIAGVQTGKYDIGMSGITVTDERKTQVNFTDTYSTGVQVVLVKEGSDIKSPDDIATLGATIAVQQSTTGDIYACDDFGEDHVLEFKTYSDVIQALIAGKADCVIMDNEPAKAFAEENEGLVILETEYVVEDYAIALNKDDADLLADINKALAELKADGTIDSIVGKYIK